MKHYFKNFLFAKLLFALSLFARDHECLLQRLNRAEIERILSENSFLLYQPALTRQIFNAVYFQPDSLSAIVAANQYHARIIFDVQLEHGLALRFNNQQAAADTHLFVAEKLAHLIRERYGDEQRWRRYARLSAFSPTEIQHFARMNAAYLKGIALTEPEEASNSLAWLRETLAHVRALEDKTKESDVLYRLSYIYSNSFGQHELALRYAERAVALSLEIKNAFGAFYGHLSMGNAYDKLLQAYEAERAFAAAYALTDSLHFEIGKGRVMEEEVDFLDTMGRYPEALELAFRQVALSKKLNDHHGTATGISWIARLYAKLGHYSEALRYLKIALAHYNALQKNGAVGHIYSELATLYYMLDQPDSASVACDQAFDYYGRLNNVEEMANVLSMKGLIEHDHPKAIALQRRALGLLSSTHFTLTKLQILANLGNGATKFGDLDGAKKTYLELCQTAARKNIRDHQARGHIELGFIYLKQNKNDSAAWHLTHGLNLAGETKASDLVWRAQYGMACALAVAEQPAEARQFFEMAMTSLQKIRRSIDRVDFNISYYGSVQEVFDRAIQFFAQESRDWRAAFHAMERAKAQSVLDLLNQPRLFFRQFSVEGGAISPDSVRAALSPRMALVEYRVSPNFLWIACLTKDRLTLRSQSIQSSTLDSLVKAYRRSIGADDYEAFAEKAESDPALAFHESSRLSQELFNIVLAPVADVLHGVEQIVFVADGSLSYLPFAILKAPQQQQNEFLIHQWNISYIPSATIWYILTTRTSLAPAAIPSRMMMKEKSEIKALLLALDSPSIPFARKEVLRLAEILPNAEPRTAQVFSKSELKNQLKFKWDFLHFATHARVRDDQPLFSHLALSNDEQNPEQQLFLSDILPFDFSQTKLVTLSACETALGRVTSGEGMLGLTQAFLCAGAPALLTSLWQVDDEQTQQLMIDFYRHYLHPSMSATAALRQAQLAMIKNLSSGMVKFPFPYFWAPFILTGQSRLASL